MKKTTLCLIFGGNSNEYKVSISTASGMLSSLDKEKYDIRLIGITRKGEWYLARCDASDILKDRWQKDIIPVLVDFNKGGFLIEGELYKPEKVLIAMHGEYGEDGRVQGLLDLLGIEYIGCNSFSSSLCMDKHLTKLVAKELGVPVANDFIVDKTHLNKTELYKRARKIGYPLFVKPSRCGSSVGVSRVTSEKELMTAVNSALEYSSKVLVEEEIKGTETEIGVIVHGKKLLSSVAGQLKHGGEFYDYYEKYEGKRTEYIIPADVSQNTEKEMGECLKKLAFALEIRGYARFDFFVKSDGSFVFNEVNTLPGFTEDSMLPMLFEYSGLDKTRLLDLLICGVSCTF